MKSKFRSMVIPVVAIVLPALALSAQAASLTVTKVVSKEQQAAASAYFTRAQIAATPPLPILIDLGPGGVDTTASLDANVIGQLSSAPAGKAAPAAAQIARTAYSEDWAALDEELLLELPADVLTGTAGVYTYYDVNTQTALWKIYPHIWDGKLTFTVPGGSASCSATAISGNNIVTAAHCVYDTTNNVWYGNWVFTPAYRNGSAPYGTFSARACTILTAWVNLSGGFSINTWTRHDVAVCTMNNNSAGQTLNSAVGWAGRLWNAGYNQLDFNSGYPAQDYNLNTIANGPTQYLRACTNESFQQTTDTLGGGCFWGPGISGGSWLVNYKPFVVTGNVNSVNSGLFVGQQNIYGARFNSSNIVPLCTARGC